LVTFSRSDSSEQTNHLIRRSVMKVQSVRLLATLALLPVTLSLFALRAQAQGEDIADLGQEVQSTRSFQQRSDQSPADWEALPDAAQKLISELLENSFEEISLIRTRQFISRLRTMQDTYTRSNQLEEASAIRNAIEELRKRLTGILPDPGNLTSYRGQNNRS